METFVVRVWVPADEAAPRTPMRGIVQHAGTGRVEAFRGSEELLALVAGMAPLRTSDGSPQDPDGRP